MRRFQLLCLVPVSAALISCDRVVPTTQPKRPATPDARTIDLRNSDRSSDVVEGDVLIQTVQGTNAVVVALDGGRPPAVPDGVVDQVFVLQRNGPGSTEGRLKLSGARILYEGTGLVIRPRDGGGALALGVDARGQLSARASTFLGRMPVRDRWSGYGLSRRTGRWVLSGPFFSADAVKNLIPSCQKPSASAAGGPARSFGIDNVCDSGGPGSTGCSTSCTGGGSCSTNCASGYHSCCDSGKCTCNCVAN